MIGDEDPLSPLAGIHTTLAYARHVYELYDAGDNLQAVIESGVGHQYTPTMFSNMLATMNRALGSG